MIALQDLFYKKRILRQDYRGDVKKTGKVEVVAVVVVGRSEKL